MKRIDMNIAKQVFEECSSALVALQDKYNFVSGVSVKNVEGYSNELELRASTFWGDFKMRLAFDKEELQSASFLSVNDRIRLLSSRAVEKLEEALVKKHVEKQKEKPSAADMLIIELSQRSTCVLDVDWITRQPCWQPTYKPNGKGGAWDMAAAFLNLAQQVPNTDPLEIFYEWCRENGIWTVLNESGTHIHVKRSPLTTAP